jgi:Phage Mu protein F like protein
MKPILRASHDNAPYTREVRQLESQLRLVLRTYFNRYVTRALRDNLNQIAIRKGYSDSIYPFVQATYKLGAAYSSNIANKEFTNSVKDKEMIDSIYLNHNDRFMGLLKSIRNMQRTENRRDFQIFAGEKERIASQLSAELIWTSFNKGIKSKGQELNVKHISRKGLQSMTREIRSEDLKKVNKQKIFVDRIQDKERTSQVTQVEKRLKKGELDPNLADLFGEKFFVVWTLVTMKDEKVCEICKDLETQDWDLDDPNVPDIPEDTHPNCRCRMAFAEIIED